MNIELPISKFRNEKYCKYFIQKINEINNGDNICFMEICGTHTHSFFKYGLKSLIPENIKLISGPGCPVCVTPAERIDKIIQYSKIKNIIITTFGDMFRVPGTDSSLEKEKSLGADIRIIYSPIESIQIAKNYTEKKIIFLGVGFETTIPAVATTLLLAQKMNLKNWFLFSAHKLIPPAIMFLANSPELRINGLMCPGHVSTIIGSVPYEPIAKQFKIPCVITGFEPVDMLEGIYMLLKQYIEKRYEVEIQYKRVVQKNGNIKAVNLMYDVFEITDSGWRGIGQIPESGLKIRTEFNRFDIEYVIPIYDIQTSKEPKECICGEILKGTKLPYDCKLFRKICSPENPIGACMVSSEGTCSAYYKYL